jgi:hypothetical protein
LHFTSFITTLKYIKFQLHMRSLWILYKMGYKFLLLVFFEELLYATMWLKLLKDWGQGAKKEVCFAHRILGFHFNILFFCTWFYMMSFSMRLFQFDFEVFDFFQEICKFQGIGVLSQYTINDKNSNSPILTNLRMEFESCVFNLI